ncbi:SGNH/GDSL hydrolase family protein [Algivirga pacifica]|uniref:GDSL-like Lipase/Acylhydrolase n=1 Tax=Algivirga pacifica TaxID=1162670 RepID=A0ABP9DJ40_9BACT
MIPSHLLNIRMEVTRAYPIIGVLMFLLSSCDPKLDTVNPSNQGQDASGNEVTFDFTNYVAVGNSLTAGFSDGALYREGQESSYPALIAEQLQAVGAPVFEQPLMPEGGGANGAVGAGLEGRLILTGFSESGLPVLEREAPSDNPYTAVSNVDSLHNYGVPGLRLIETAAAGLGTLNPFFSRMLSTSDLLSSYQEVIVQSDPTFFTFWLGNNDILGYATSGGVFGVEGNPDLLGLNGITSASAFELTYNTFIENLTADGQTYGVVMNIPDVLQIPFFTAIPWNSLELDSATATVANATIAQLIRGQVTQEVVVTVVLPTVVAGLVSAGVIPESQQESLILAYTQAYIENPSMPQAVGGFSQDLFDQITQIINTELQKDTVVLIINQATQNAITEINQTTPGAIPEFQAGANGLIVQDLNSPTGLKQLTEGEYVLLSASEKLAQLQETIASGGLDLLAILPLLPTDAEVLDKEEVENIETAIEMYNGIIRNVVDDNEFIILYDVYADYEQVIEQGVNDNGVVLTGDFVTGGAFSLDGIHLTPRGYAYVANRLIQTMNREWKLNIPGVNLIDYRAVEYP